MAHNPNALPVNSIAVGDCIQTMNRWPAASLDLIFADPPYNIGYQYDQYEDKQLDADYIAWTQNWITAAARLLKPTGSFYILIGDEYAAETRLHLKALERDKQLAFRNWIIWHYTFGQNAKAKFNRSHVHLFYCVGPAVLDRTKKIMKGSNKQLAADMPFTFNRSEIAVPSARQTTYGDARANPAGKLPDDTWYLRPQDVEKEGIAAFLRPDEDTWYLSRLCGTFKERLGWHPCQLPEALLERIIKLSSTPGSIVFDPFTGSGTTLAVAARLKRQWLGCELSDEYALKAAERIEHAARTGSAMLSTQDEKGMTPQTRKKKPEPKRSAGLKRKRNPDNSTSLF